MQYKSEYPGLLILPTGQEIKAGTSIDLSDEQLKNEGVAGWVKSGWLVSAAKAKPEPAKPAARD